MILDNIVPLPFPLLEIYAVGFSGIGILALVFKNDSFWSKGELTDKNKLEIKPIKKVTKLKWVLFFSLVLIALIAIFIINNNKKDDTYKGGYRPDGTYCDYGYDPNTKSCCGDDDYSCEYRDKGATAECGDGTYSFNTFHIGSCSFHGGVSNWLK